MLRVLRYSQFIVQHPLQSVSGQAFTQIRTKKKKAGGAAAKKKILDVRGDVKGLIDLKKYDESMRHTVDSLKNSYARMRSGTVSPDFLDDLPVEAYGSKTSLKTLAQVSVRDARTMFVTTFDDQVVGAVEKAVRGAGLNLNPIVEGNGRMRIPVPKPSQESREALKDAAQKEAESAKVATRMVRRKALEEVNGLKDEMSKDDKKRMENNIQVLTDNFIEKINKLQKSKVDSITEANLSVRK